LYLWFVLEVGAQDPWIELQRQHIAADQDRKDNKYFEHCFTRRSVLIVPQEAVPRIGERGRSGAIIKDQVALEPPRLRLAQSAFRGTSRTCSNLLPEVILRQLIQRPGNRHTGAIGQVQV